MNEEKLSGILLKMALDKGYVWLLGVSVLLVGFTAWMDRPEPVLATPSKNAAPRHASAPSTAPIQVEQPQANTAYRPELGAAVRDLFALEQVTAPKPALLTETAMEVVPTTPPLNNVRFLGSFTDPTGHQVLYISLGEQEIEAKVGESLTNGYVITAADAQAIYMEHPLSGAKTTVLLSPEQ